MATVLFLEEIEAPTGSDVGPPDFGHQVTFIDGDDEPGLLQIDESAAGGILAAVAKSSCLSHAQRDLAVVVAVVLADQQPQDIALDGLQSPILGAVEDGMR